MSPLSRLFSVGVTPAMILTLGLFSKMSSSSSRTFVRALSLGNGELYSTSRKMQSTALISMTATSENNCNSHYFSCTSGFRRQYASNSIMMRQSESCSSKRFHRPNFHPLMAAPLGRNDDLRRSLRLFSTKSSSDSKEKESSTATDLPSLRRLVSQAATLHDANLNASPLNYEQILSRLSDLETESSDPSFWEASNSKRNKIVNQEIGRYSRLKEQMEKWTELRGECESALELLEEMIPQKEESNDSNDDEMIQLLTAECQASASKLIELSEKHELQSLLSGPYDHCPARIVLTAGAGGTEACDWVAMLYRMYTRHAQHMNCRVVTTDISDGDVVGYKSVEMEVEGVNAYGWFKGEKGAHRLVRLSPFNANNKRQTTFAGVDVSPILEEEEIRDIEVPESELEITTMRSGGKGGQNVNKVETGVRIKHIPSGIAVKCTQERSQSMNKALAMTRLKAQLLAIAQEQRLESIRAIRGDVVEASWGAQIRNYVMQPYKMVKDARTGFETSDVDGVLDGGEALGDFVGSWLRWRREKEEEERAEKELA